MVESRASTLRARFGEFEPTPSALSSLMTFLYTGCIELPVEDSMYLLAAAAFFGLSNDRLLVC
jgi:hypothetical protein